ncbi:MAG: 2-C-methyl-D-erythritol 4-phosphate cytidylyltransferase, partial [Nocardiopsis sp. BM-2018]
MSAGPRVIAAVLAGGVGARMGAPSPKQLLPLEGRPIIEHSIAAFEASPEVDEIVVLMVEEYVGRVEDIVAEAGFGKVSRVLAGGATRTDT